MRLLFSCILIICAQYCSGQEQGTQSSYTELYNFIEDNHRSDAPDSVKRLNLYNKLTSLIKAHPKDEMNFNLIFLGKNLSYKQIRELADLIDSSIKHLPASVWINETLSRVSAAETGKPFPELILKDSLGNELALSSLKGKVVLIDVWGSWCGPCREQIPELRKLYKKYNSKGFEMIGVSLENKKEKWLEAIKKDKQVWKQYCELAEFAFDTEFSRRFHITSIPVNYLIDENGILAGQDFSPASIASWLAQHLK